MMLWTLLHPEMTPEHLGLLPSFLIEEDPRPAKEQFQERYIYGGWRPMKGFKLNGDYALWYPGDPLLHPIAMTKLRDEIIFLYRHDWVAILQPDGSFEVSRMD
jgi:hypothetical protein